jgi:hypothetical protein
LVGGNPFCEDHCPGHPIHEYPDSAGADNK